MSLSKGNHFEQVKEKIRVASQQRELPFSAVLSDEAIVSELQRAHPDFRDRVYSPMNTLLMFMSQSLCADGSCRQAVARANADRVVRGLEACSPNTGAYCQARQKLNLSAIQTLAKNTSSQLESDVPSSWLWRNRHVKIVDGTTLLMADTPENQSAYPQQSEQKLGCGYPIVRAVAIMSLSTGAILDLDTAPYKGKQTGEVSIFKNMLSTFSHGDIVLADAIYPTYFMICELKKRR